MLTVYLFYLLHIYYHFIEYYFICVQDILGLPLSQ